MSLSGSPPDRIFRFGQFELSERERELRKKGIRIKLHEQPFQVLTELLANPGRIVTREELQQKLWSADIIVDYEVGLNQAVSKIRQALSDDADHPRYIETVAKRGYRFLAPVQEDIPVPGLVASAPQAAISPLESTQPENLPNQGRPRPQNRARYFVAAALVIIILTVGILWQLRRSAPRLSLEKRITANPAEASIQAAVVSPDGKFVVYADPTGVYLRQIDSGETRPLSLPKDFRAYPTSWFPDSTHLLVTSRDRSEQNASIWKVSILGGVPQMVLDSAEDGVVSPDGSLIAYFHRSPAALYGLRAQAIFHTVGELWLASSDGQNPRRFVVPAETAGLQSVGAEVTAVSWAPDGRSVAYIERHKAVAHSRSGDQSWLLTRGLNGGPSQLILRDRRLYPADLCWTQDGRLLYAWRADPKNPRGDYGVQAIRVDSQTGRASGEPYPVSNGLGWIGGLSVTADGKRLLLWRGNTLPQVFVSEFDRGKRRLTPPRRLTLDENANEPSAWLSDSKSVLFLSDRFGAWRLFRQGVDQTIAEVALEAQNLQVALPRLSADGSQILFAEVSGVEDPSAPVRILGQPLSGGAPRLILQDPGIDGFLCANAPASACVYDRVIKNTSTLVAFDATSGKAREIATFNDWPNWSLSPDGSQLAVVTDGHQGRVEFLSLQTGARRDVVVKDWPVLRGTFWAADSSSLFITSFNSSGTSVLLEVDLHGNAHVLLESEPHAQIFWAIPSPDGLFAALDVITGEDNVWMVENF